MQNSEPADWVKQMLAELATPESTLRSEKEDRFLREVICAGLKDLNTGFDSPLIGHFSPEDFLIVIDRCESLGVDVIGIEVSTTDVEPPSKLQLVEIEISPVPGYPPGQVRKREQRSLSRGKEHHRRRGTRGELGQNGALKRECSPSGSPLPRVLAR
jgi:hypothetical protein